VAWRWCAIPGRAPVPLKATMMLRCAARAGGHVASSSRADRRPPAINPSASGVRMPTSPGCWAGLRWQAPDLDGLEMPSLRGGVEGLTARPRYSRVRATAAGAPPAAADCRFCVRCWCHGCGSVAVGFRGTKQLPAVRFCVRSMDFPVHAFCSGNSGVNCIGGVHSRIMHLY
jgi:hypothetical protein